MCARAFPVDLLRRRTERIEDVLDECQRHLAFARVHRVGAGILQGWKIAQVGCARQHADGGVQLARCADDLGAVRHPGGGQHKGTGRRHARRGQRINLGRVSVDRAESLLLERSDALHVELDDGG